MSFHIALHLATFDGGGSGMYQRSYRGFEKTLSVNYVPDVGEHVVLWVDKGEPDYDGPEGEIRTRVLGANGEPFLELKSIVVNPTEEEQKYMNVRGSWFERHMAWWTDRDGDIYEQLRSHGWIEADG